MEPIARVALIAVIILLALIIFLPLVIFPPDRITIDPNFPQLTGPYLGQKPPGRMPQRFAPNIIASEAHTAAVFSPDGTEVYWRLMAEDVDEILFSRLEEGKWTHPQVLPYASRSFDSGDPCFSPDGNKLFFTSWRPVSWYQIFDSKERIWYVERTERGWSKPREVGSAINSMNLHWQFSVAETGSLYFVSNGDIYRSVFENGQYQEPSKLDSGVNTPSNEGHPYISPDESYLIFSSNDQSNSVGDYDLYVSLQREDGSWSKAINLGSGVNSPYQDLYPVVSPEQKYLFFLSNRNGMHSVYWVDFEPIKKLISEKSTED